MYTQTLLILNPYQLNGWRWPINGQIISKRNTNPIQLLQLHNFLILHTFLVTFFNHIFERIKRRKSIIISFSFLSVYRLSKYLWKLWSFFFRLFNWHMFYQSGSLEFKNEKICIDRCTTKFTELYNNYWIFFLSIKC